MKTVYRTSLLILSLVVAFAGGIRVQAQDFDDIERREAEREKDRKETEASVEKIEANRKVVADNHRKIRRLNLEIEAALDSFSCDLTWEVERKSKEDFEQTKTEFEQLFRLTYPRGTCDALGSAREIRECQSRKRDLEKLESNMNDLRNFNQNRC